MSGASSRTLTRSVVSAGLLTLLGACVTRPPSAPVDETQRLQQAGVALQLPVGAGLTVNTPADTPAMAWQAVVRDPQLRRWIEQALAHNRDLRVATLTVQRAQAQLGLADANRLPTVGAGLGASRAPNGQGKEATTLTAGVQLNAWEIDLFGRLASLSDAARAQLLSSEAGRRATELTVVAAVLQTGLALQADDELLDLARQALASREQTLKLTQLRESVGAASLLELQAQQTLALQARTTLAQLTRQQAQDRNALALLLGQPAAVDAAPAGATATAPKLADETWLSEVPVGLSSAVLLRRPDVISAEQTMRAAQANIAAARAAFWPSITLTAQAGQASPQLSGLFAGGNFAYSLAANALLTVFDSGRRQANVAVAEAAQRSAQALYERSIQSAFRDTADALAGLTTWREQLAAQTAQRDVARDTARLTELKASQGAASALERLDAQRALFVAEQAVVQVRLGELNNRVGLFKALGG